MGVSVAIQDAFSGVIGIDTNPTGPVSMNTTSVQSKSLILSACALACITLSSDINALPAGYSPHVISPFLYTGSGNYAGGWGLQGIKSGPSENTFIITGTSNINGVVYDGPIDNGFTSPGSGAVSGGSGTGTWYLMNVPTSINSAVSTSIYGPDSLGDGNYNLVGTYTSSNDDNTYSFFYTGPLTSTPDASDFVSVQAKYANGQGAQYTILHSVSGGLAAGNYGSPNSLLGNAFIYDPQNIENSQIDLKFPDKEKSYSVYGIWSNGGNSYTVAGGVSGGLIDKKTGQPVTLAYLMDFDRVTGLTSNYQTFQYKPVGAAKRYFNNDAIITHFEGIWSNGKGLYKLPATVTSFTGGLSIAVTAEVVRKPNGSFSKTAKWKQISLPGSTFSTNDSISGDTSIGVVQYSNPSDGSKIFTNYVVTPIKK